MDTSIEINMYTNNTKTSCSKKLIFFIEFFPIMKKVKATKKDTISVKI